MASNVIWLDRNHPLVILVKSTWYLLVFLLSKASLHALYSHMLTFEYGPASPFLIVMYAGSWLEFGTSTKVMLQHSELLLTNPLTLLVMWMAMAPIPYLPLVGTLYPTLVFITLPMALLQVDHQEPVWLPTRSAGQSPIRMVYAMMQISWLPLMLR